MQNQQSFSLQLLQEIPKRTDTIRTRGGFYPPAINVWAPEDLDHFLNGQKKTCNRCLLQVFSLGNQQT